MEAEAQKDLNIQRFSTPYDKNKKVPLNMMDCEVLIEEGELLMGIIDKNSIGNTKSGGITHVLMNDRGPDAAKAFLGLNQRMVNYWLMNRGFSVGLGDMVPTPETMNEVMDLIAKAKRKVTSLIQQGQHKQLEKQPGKTIEQYFEWSVNSELNTMANQTQKTIMKHLKSDKTFLFDYMEDLIGMDFGEKLGVIYRFYSTENKQRIVLICQAESREKPELPSATPWWGIANFYEREDHLHRASRHAPPLPAQRLGRLSPAQGLRCQPGNQSRAAGCRTDGRHRAILH